MNTIDVFDAHVEEYEHWFEVYPYVFQSEVEAIREMLPEGDQLSGIEVGIGTGRYASALGITQGVEPSPNMRRLAVHRGIEIIDGSAEHLPYGDLRFDFVVMTFMVSYLKNIGAALGEVHRVLKNHGVLLIGFIDKDSTIGKRYVAHKSDSTFYQHANFYSVDKIIGELVDAGFRHLKFNQTLFGDLDEIKSFQPARNGYGEGSFVVVRAAKKRFRK